MVKTLLASGLVKSSVFVDGREFWQVSGNWTEILSLRMYFDSARAHYSKMIEIGGSDFMNAARSLIC